MMSPFELDDRITAAAVAAVGTVVGALIQLRAAWRREVSERARGVPATKKSRRGPVLAVFLLLIAAAVGGFALSQYVLGHSEHESTALRGELQTQLAQISAAAERLERASLAAYGATGRADDERRGADDVTVTSTVGPCRARGVAATDAPATCSEPEALRVTLCGSVPSSAVVTDVALYAKPEDSAQPWTESRVAAGQDLGRARFADKPFERAESDRTKQACTGFSAWDAEHAYSARLVVKYASPPVVREVSHVVIAPISEGEH